MQEKWKNDGMKGVGRKWGGRWKTFALDKFNSADAHV